MTEIDSINPPHYRVHPSGIECIEVCRLCSFSMGNFIKYIWRYADKNGIEDLQKAQWYLHDIVNSGASHYLPYKARELLRQVILSENSPMRLALFKALLENGALFVLKLLTAELRSNQWDTL